MKTKVAIYACYSTDKQDESSIGGQVKNCNPLSTSTYSLIALAIS